MTNLTYYDTKTGFTYHITHDRGDFLGAVAVADGGGDPIRTYEFLSELPLPVKQKVETLLCQPSQPSRQS